MRYLLSTLAVGIILTACTERVVELATASLVVDACEEVTAPCVIEVSESATAKAEDPVAVKYMLCCPEGVVEMSILEVTSDVGNWGDVTRWGVCRHAYVEEFTHPNRLDAPWAILHTFDGQGGPITSCQTSNAPL